MYPTAAAMAKSIAQKESDVALDPTEALYRQDLLLRSKFTHIFTTGEEVVPYYVDNSDFLEVQSPILTTRFTGGAGHNDLNMKMFMQIATGLFIKQLVFYGTEHVYDLEDLTHNPESTKCEFFMAYADHNYLMELTEQMLSGMVKELTGGYKVKYRATGLDNDPVEIDFTPPYRRIDMIEELEKMTNLSIPKDLGSDEAKRYLADACTKLDIKCPMPQTTRQLLDKLVECFLVETCVNPTFLIDHSVIVGPKANLQRSKAGLTSRFGLFYNKRELVNAYTELNECQQFVDQLKGRQSGDDDPMALVDNFMLALEFDLQPADSWGLGIDRLTMLFTDPQGIKEVLISPFMKTLSENEPNDELPGEPLPHDKPNDEPPVIGDGCVPCECFKCNKVVSIMPPSAPLFEEPVCPSCQVGDYLFLDPIPDFMNDILLPVITDMCLEILSRRCY